jgi:putative flippase GtrA
MIFNYLGARRLVFHSQQKHTVVLPKYVLLVIVNGLLSYTLILAIHSRLGLRPILAKLWAEGLLFAASFALQRAFVFTRKNTSGGSAAD